MHAFTFFVFVLFASSANAVLRRGTIVQNSLARLRAQSLQTNAPLSDIEAQELKSGAEEASKGEGATLHDDPDEAEHEFSLGAERLEAASNDADAGKNNDSSAESRKKVEHEIAERLEHLAQENRRRSADEIFGTTSTEKPESQEKETEKAKNPEEEEWTLGDETTPQPSFM